MIRAVKYGAVTGFKLPLSLRLKIRAQSKLLEGISPSRLTEEIAKIIRSSHAREIVEDLDAAGLYSYLQPRATELFKTARGFRDRYLETMGALNKEDFKNLYGESLTALIRDYLEDNVDWDGKRDEAEGIHTPLADRCKNAFVLARKFVLPMNPPRMELDAALRLLFARHGVAVKKARFNERPPRKARPNPVNAAP
jgi:poly(A) polymerase